MARGRTKREASQSRWAKPAGRRFSIRFTGLLYIVVTMLLVVAGVNSQNNLLFIAFGLGIGGLLVSGFISGAGMMSLRVRRSGVATRDGFAVVGEPVRVRYSIRNTSRWLPMFAVHLSEPIGDGAGVIRGFAMYVPARRAVLVDGVAHAVRRGVFDLKRIELWSVFPLGIARKRVWHDQPDEIVVRPEPYELVRAPVPRARSTRAEKMAKQARRSPAGEFFALRDYADGDPIRSIAWKRTAMLDRPVVRQLSGVPSQQVMVWVSVSGHDERADDRAISAAIAVIDRLSRHGSHVGLAAGGVVVQPGSGARHLRQLTRALCELDTSLASPQPTASAEMYHVASGAAPQSRSADLVPESASSGVSP